jgi:hypothetical protein
MTETGASFVPTRHNTHLWDFESNHTIAHNSKEQSWERNLHGFLVVARLEKRELFTEENCELSEATTRTKKSFRVR